MGPRQRLASRDWGIVVTLLIGALVLSALSVGLPGVATGVASARAAAAPGHSATGRHKKRHRRHHARKHHKKKGGSGPPPAPAHPRKLAIDSAVVTSAGPNEIGQFTVDISVSDPTAYDDNLVVYLSDGSCQTTYAGVENYLNSQGLAASLSNEGVAEDLGADPSQTAGRFTINTGQRSGYSTVCGMVYTAVGNDVYKAYVTARGPITDGS